MKFHLFLFCLLILVGCTNQPLKKNIVNISDIEGIWVCSITDDQLENKSHEVILYLKQGVCHYGDFQENQRTYSIQKGVLTVTDETGSIQRAKIVDAQNKRLTLQLLTDWQGQFNPGGVKAKQLLHFKRINSRNAAVVKRFSISRSEPEIDSMSYVIQYDSNRSFLFFRSMGQQPLEMFTGRTDEKFWRILMDKIHLLKVPLVKGHVGEVKKNEPELGLEIATDIGTISCSFLHTDMEHVPAEMHDLAQYIHSNYDAFKMVRFDESKIFENGNSPRRKKIVKILEKIPC